MQQRGLATLWASTVLLILTSLWGWLCLQSVHAESMRSHQQMHAAQALVNSEALLETVLPFVERVYANETNQTTQMRDADLALWSAASASNCPSDKAPPQWQCMRWPLAELPLPEWTDAAQSWVRLVRDVRNAPHRIQILVDAQLNALHAGKGSRATIQQSLYVPLTAPLSNVSAAALVLNEQVLSANASATATATTATQPTCDPQAWRNVFGLLTPIQLKTLSALQARNGLSDQTQATRTVYWIDSPQLWTQSLGSVTFPVVLVFSELACAFECPSMASFTKVVGTVFYQSQCQASKMAQWQAGVIQGQLGMESSLAPALKTALLNGQAGLTATANAHAAFDFAWPDGLDASRVQRVAGTWKNAGY
jgi:hypothetical protein